MPPPRRRGYVLVVDDEEDVREVCRLNLELAGFDVLVARDGEDGLRLAREGSRPDLILLDIMLPRRDGWSCLQELKADPRLGGVPVVVVTAKTWEADRLLGGLGMGAAAYVRKPFDPLRLVEVVERVLETSGAG